MQHEQHWSTNGFINTQVPEKRRSCTSLMQVYRRSDESSTYWMWAVAEWRSYKLLSITHFNTAVVAPSRIIITTTIIIIIPPSIGDVITPVFLIHLLHCKRWVAKVWEKMARFGNRNLTTAPHYTSTGQIPSWQTNSLSAKTHPCLAQSSFTLKHHIRSNATSDKNLTQHHAITI
jgi:hypothetical protein